MSKKIQVCMGSSCFARGNNKNLDVITKYIRDNNLNVEIELSGLRCCSLCSKGPNITIDGVEYNNVDSGTLIDILDKNFKG
ncbi:MAG: (2Fe-2S) ferredoxin domain-containing protein [Alphaproteobacteria bacterium]|nr:(2Fe-2S) ferredoxin domain-containing protein [Alphaproteobacteria bacterium]